MSLVERFVGGPISIFTNYEAFNSEVKDPLGRPNRRKSKVQLREGERHDERDSVP